MSTAFLVDNILNEKEDRPDSLSSSASDIESEADTASDLKDSLCGSPDNSEMLHATSPSGDTKLHLSETLLRTYNSMMRNGAGGDHHLGIEMCCSKCGHFQIVKPRSNSESNSFDESDAECDFKCDKCDSNEGVHAKETILKDSAKPILKFSVSAILSDKKDCAKVRNGKICSLSFWFNCRENRKIWFTLIINYTVDSQIKHQLSLNCSVNSPIKRTSLFNVRLKINNHRWNESILRWVIELS